ncbi:hypothetical protein EV356DRAFT_536317 [Viridothelium virens]|uniref:Transcription factor TFIIIC triple barrel domain-containing protein n=1 Tax=Viridothelium virens TaxID=1048519 RepID=A0A6A6GXG9_VIRVR|nr:hypothetical protein EV356DRAFT_536317 [Viridothelium virens]
MAKRDLANGGSDHGVDSEWEYEYSQEESEDLYFVLEFPIPVEPETEPKITKRANIVFSSSGDALADAQDGSVTPEWSPDPAMRRPSAVKDDIQITDLHSLHPLVAYKRQIYSCNWASTLGTDMIFYRPVNEQSEQQPADPPSRLVATTAAKLVAKPIEVRARESNPLRPPTAIPAVGNGLQTGETEQSKVQKQKDFLERLQAAKSKRGEVDSVPMEPILTLKRPVDWVDQEKFDQARAEHEGRKRKSNNDEGAPKTPKARKPKSKGDTPVEKGQPTRRGSGRRVGQPSGRKSNRELRNLLGLKDTDGEKGESQEAGVPANGENDSASISIPTPAHFDFVESEDGQRTATVPRDSFREVAANDLATQRGADTMEDSD